MTKDLNEVKNWPLIVTTDGMFIKAKKVQIASAGFLILSKAYQVKSTAGDDPVILVGPRVNVPLVNIAYWTQ